MGSRRSGKSKILELIIGELLEKGVSKDHIISNNFEDLSFDDIDDYKKLNAFIKKRLMMGNIIYFLMRFIMLNILKRQ